MPKKNAIKEYGEGELYHLYNRGVAKMNIFLEEADYWYMLGLLKKYLSDETAIDSSGRLMPNYADELDLVAFCLMPNHYHFLVYLKEKEGIEHLMRSVMTAYTMYFNKKYQRSGGLFEGRFLASRIADDSYYQHISRYIHLNPLDIGENYLIYPYSSLAYYLGKKHASWLHPERGMNELSSADKYSAFLKDYESVHDERKRLKHLLAGL